MDNKIKENQGLRMYFFVMGNISGRQQGIQAGHAAVEYQLKHGKGKQYKEFANYHKTFILLDGGGSIDMIEREKELESFGVPFASFQEPDLNNSISAIAFIVPEMVYGINIDKAFIEHAEKYPSFMNMTMEYAKYLKGFRLASN